jgi:hypothetical protein
VRSVLALQGMYLAYMQICFPQLLSAGGYIPWDVNTKVRRHNFAKINLVHTPVHHMTSGQNTSIWLVTLLYLRISEMCPMIL